MINEEINYESVPEFNRQGREQNVHFVMSWYCQSIMHLHT